MNLVTLKRPVMGEPLLPQAAHRTRSRLAALVEACGVSLRGGEPLDEQLNQGVVTSSAANLALAATSCDRPLLYPECELMAQILCMDLVLFRFDALYGASFDMLLNEAGEWLHHYVAWRLDLSGLWLIPCAGSVPYFRLSSDGLEPCELLPFQTGYQRYAGIMRAAEKPSFEGGY